LEFYGILCIFWEIKPKKNNQTTVVPVARLKNPSIEWGEWRQHPCACPVLTAADGIHSFSAPNLFFLAATAGTGKSISRFVFFHRLGWGEMEMVVGTGEADGEEGKNGGQTIKEAVPLCCAVFEEPPKKG
jgi:hypothetical protein